MLPVDAADGEMTVGLRIYRVHDGVGQSGFALMESKA